MSDTVVDDQTVDEEPDIDDEEPAARESKEFVCDEPDCGRSFKTKMGLGYHKRKAHNILGEDAKRADRPKASTGSRGGSQSSRKRKVKETLDELADTIDDLSGRRTSEEPLTFPEMLRSYGDGIAGSLAWTAERVTPLGLVIDRMLGHGGIVTIAQGFLRPGRWLLVRWRGWAASRQEAEEGFMFSDPSEYVGQPGEPPV